MHGHGMDEIFLQPCSLYLLECLLSSLSTMTWASSMVSVYQQSCTAAGSQGGIISYHTFTARISKNKCAIGKTDWLCSFAVGWVSIGSCWGRKIKSLVRRSSCCCWEGETLLGTVTITLDVFHCGYPSTWVDDAFNTTLNNTPSESLGT